MKRNSLKILNYLKFLLLIPLIISSSYADSVYMPREITLTKEEKQWLDSQDEIRFSVTNCQKPVVFTNSSGALEGIIPEYVNMLTKIIGKKIKLIMVRLLAVSGYPLETARSPIVDIDFFKKINDTYGHQVGDQVLESFAQIFRERTRDTDIVGRWGGEEFLLICPGTNLDGILKISENIREFIEKYVFNKVGYKTASFGVTSYQSGDTFESILRRADEALYKAKESGRNRVVFM